MINSNSLIAEIQNTFPSFTIDPQFADILTVIGGDMSGFIADNINSIKPASKELVEFLNEVVESVDADSKLVPFLSEIILGLYDLKDKSKYNLLRDQLSTQSQQYFDRTVSIWLEGNAMAG